MTIATIVVATDGSDAAQRAVTHAAQVASACDASVVAVHVFEPLALLGHIEPPVDFAGQEEAARTVLRDVWCQPLADAGVSFSAQVVEGLPAASIIDAANEADADLIVIGARGVGRVKELVLGSTSSEVLHHAGRPVTVVPAH